MLLFIGLFIIVVIVVYVAIRLFLWIFEILDCKIHHMRFKDRPKLKRGYLKGYLKSNYGKRKGRDIYNKIRSALKKKGIK